MITLHGIIIKGEPYAVAVIDETKINSDYKLIVYNSNGDHYKFEKTLNESGLNTELFPVSDGVKYTIALHNKDYKLIYVKFYDFDDLNITDYNALELEHDPEETEEETKETEKEPEEIKESEEEINLEIKKIRF